MKIYFFGSDYPPTNGGISTYTTNLLGAMSRESGVEGRARIFGNKNPRTETLNNQLEIILVRSVNFFYVGWRILIDIITHHDYDVLYALNLFPIGFWVIFWSKIFHKKGIITFYGADACDTRTSKKVVWLQKWAITHAYKAITISIFTRDAVVKKYGIIGNNIEVVYPLLPQVKNEKIVPVATRSDMGLALDDFVVVSICRLVKRKGVEYLIDALSMSDDVKIKAIIVGDGDERAGFEDRVREAGLADRIKFVGKAPDLTPYYSIADCVTLLSYMRKEEGDFEGLGLVLLEAQSYGVPVIGTISGGIPEAFVNDKTGIAVSEREARAVLDAILKLKDDVGLHQSMSMATTGFLITRFGKKNTIDNILKFL